jgi:methylmalonyl-CoA mutase C-terminal domain/subunit
MSEKRPIRVLIAKPGLDGHDRGAKVLALGLREEGMEVIYTGIRQTAASIVVTAVQENVDVVALSSLAASHLHHFPKVCSLLADAGMGDVTVIGGGIIPEEDIEELKEKGVQAVFGPGTAIEDVATFIRERIKRS